MRYFAGGVPSMRQHVGSSSTPVLGWKSSSTPHAALRSQPRLMHNANSSSLYRMPQQQQQQQQPIAGEAAKWGAAAAVFGSIATPGGASPEHIKQRLSFEGPDTAARPGVPSAAAVAGRRPLHDGPGLFTRALVQAAPNMGVAVGAYAASMPAAADRGPAVYTVSPATAAGAAAAVAPPYLPLAGVVFAGLPQRQAPDITQLEQEVAEMQRQMDKCVKRHRVGWWCLRQQPCTYVRSKERQWQLHAHGLFSPTVQQQLRQTAVSSWSSHTRGRPAQPTS